MRKLIIGALLGCYVGYKYHEYKMEMADPYVEEVAEEVESQIEIDVEEALKEARAEGFDSGWKMAGANKDYIQARYRELFRDTEKKDEPKPDVRVVPSEKIQVIRTGPSVTSPATPMTPPPTPGRPQ